MTIYQDDIKLFESKVMTDESDGGGAMTDQEIISGEHNSIFPDISDLDRAYGVVGIRSVHLKVDADTDETYYGATIGLSETPTDEMVEVTLLATNDPYIEREEIKDIIERYLTSGVRYQGELYYTQVEGQRSIRLMQYTHIDPPSVGDVLILNGTGGDQQYVKITSVSYETQQFTEYVSNSYIDFNLRVVVCEISEPLRYTFVGSAPKKSVPASSNSSVYETMVADASKYYGTKQLSADGVFGESVAQVDSIYNQLVPSARIEEQHVNIQAVTIINAPVAINAAGTEQTTIPLNCESQSIEVTVNTQGYVYTQTLLPYPSFGTLQILYMAQGNWYTLKDDGTGVLSGVDSSHGAATVDALGNVALTTGALPDVGSEIIFQWASTSIDTALVGDDDIVLNKTTIVSATDTPNNDDMTFTWDDGNKVATCIDGEITGDATGSVINKIISFTPNVLPEPGTVVNTQWNESLGGVTLAHVESEEYTMISNNGYYTFNRVDVIGSSITIQVTPSDYSNANGRANYSLEVLDVELFFWSSGLVSTQIPNGNKVADTSSHYAVGSYNKSTGDVSLDSSLFTFKFIHQEWDKKRNHWYSSSKSWTITKRTATYPQCEPLNLIFTASSYKPLSTSEPLSAGTFDFTIDSAKVSFADQGIDLLSETARVNLNGSDYQVTDTNTVTSNGEAVGTFDDESNVITLTSWAAGTDELTISTGLYQYSNVKYMQDMVFVTVGNPVGSQTLQINAIDANGTHQLGVADENGDISGGGFTGTINYDLGIITIANDNPIQSSEVKYNCVSYNYLPLDSEQLGLDPIRLPSDGRVVVFEKGDVVVIHQDDSETITVEAGDTVQLEVRLATCTTTADDAVIDLDAGTVLFPTAGTYDINYRFEDMVLLTYVDISGAVKLSQPLSHNYDKTKSKMASLLIAGDLFARYTNLFDQKSWGGTFSDELQGDEAPVSYNDTLYPIQVTDDGCITERMAIVFTSSTSFKLVGEHIGQIAVGDINTDFAPINPVSGKPYFTLNKLGWGSGWSNGNALRFDIYGAVYQLNIIRTILQGDSTNALESDQFALQIRGNINKVVL